MGTFAITGSASGIGGATRARVEAAGHTVIGVDLRDAEVTADLGTPDGRQAAIDGVLERCGGTLDGLVTAAGVGPPFPAVPMASINYFGSVVLLEALQPALVASGDAQVVVVSSNSTSTQPNLPMDLVDAFLAGDESRARELAERHGDAYAPSKLALARWVRRNAPTPGWAGAGVRLNAIAPGATLTPLLQGGLDDETFGPLIQQFPVPTGGFADADEIAAGIEFLLLSDARRFLCGTILYVDGGTDALFRADSVPVPWVLDA
jgi:NAD(P)-dependent dehydrogenase (short-subunit alcohol dehydrogenase family)